MRRPPVPHERDFTSSLRSAEVAARVGLWLGICFTVAFLTGVWRDGALFGATPQEAFFVKCDADTNPPDVRDQGQVVTEVGVAVVKPAEFVIFRIAQIKETSA